MSRIGKKPIEIPEGVSVEIKDQEIKVKGPKGELKQKIHPKVKVTEKDKSIIVSVVNPKEKEERALWGTSTSLIRNMIEGVINGFQKQLEINGVGYTWQLKGQNLTIKAGFSHPIEFELPSAIEGKVEKNTLTISGIDKQLVGSVAAEIRAIRKPEPYKGKGIKYVDEVIRRKAGKQVTAAEGVTPSSS